MHQFTTVQELFLAQKLQVQSIGHILKLMY